MASVITQGEFMYIPKHFKVNDQEEIYEFIKANSFGQLISIVDGKLFSTHMPFLLSEDKSSILGHIAKPNPQHIDLDSQEVLITIQGEHGYISPSWYENPGVPTWNYQAVHIYGRCAVFTDAEKLKIVVDNLTRKYEISLPKPWLPDYKSSKLSGIVGVEIKIRELQCKFKLSQNRSNTDRHQVIKNLHILGSHKLAEAMERNGLYQSD